MLREGKCRSEKQTQCEPINLLMSSACCDCRVGNLADLPWKPGVPGPQAAGWRWMALKGVPALIPPPLLPPPPISLGQSCLEPFQDSLQNGSESNV